MGLQPKREDSCLCNRYDDERRNYGFTFPISFLIFASPLMKKEVFFRKENGNENLK